VFNIQSDVFWKAAVLTAIVFIVGIQLGVWLDESRLQEIEQTLSESDLLFNDIRLQTLFYDSFLSKSPQFCDIAEAANLAYNDRIYQEGLRIERYELVNRFTPGMMQDRRRYALQQVQFWTNALKIKEICNSSYTTILHLWQYDTKNVSEIELPQKLQSATLLELKERCGSRLMLSNAPIDLNLTAVDFIVKNYNITQMPALVVNEATFIQGFTNITALQSMISC
jgi:hypothetical protein